MVDSGGVSLPDSKTGAQMRPIGKTAIDLLQARSRAGADWIFRRIAARVTSSVFRKCWRASAARRLEGDHAARPAPQLRVDRRRARFSELTIAGLLGHSAGSVTAGYVHLDQALVIAADA